LVQTLVGRQAKLIQPIVSCFTVYFTDVCL